MSKVFVLAIIATILAAALFGCEGNGVTSPGGPGYSQDSLTGTWERPDGARFTFDSSGALVGMIGGRNQVIGYSGSMTVNDAEGNVSGTIHLTHIHDGGSTDHSHPVMYSGEFSSDTVIRLSWYVPGAGSGTTTWTRAA